MEAWGIQKRSRIRKSRLRGQAAAEERGRAEGPDVEPMRAADDLEQARETGEVVGGEVEVRRDAELEVVLAGERGVEAATMGFHHRGAETVAKSGKRWGWGQGGRSMAGT
jgi:hypothetical protein